jgi:hypothetical protein
MKTIDPTAVGAAIAGIAAAAAMILLAAGSARADTGPAAESDQVTVPQPPTSQQNSQPKMKKEWIRSDGASVFF